MRRSQLFNEWAEMNKPDATLEDWTVFMAGYDARNREVVALRCEIARLQEIIEEKNHEIGLG